MIGGSSCARMDTESGLWRSVSCETQQPYVCKKPLNETVTLPGALLASSSVQISFEATALWSRVNACQTRILTFPSPDTANVLSIPRTHARMPCLCMFEIRLGMQSWRIQSAQPLCLIDELWINERRYLKEQNKNDMPIILILWNYVFVETKTRIWQWLFECISMWFFSLFLYHNWTVS